MACQRETKLREQEGSTNRIVAYAIRVRACECFEKKREKKQGEGREATRRTPRNTRGIHASVLACTHEMHPYARLYMSSSLAAGNVETALHLSL
jgi:hypothetical protein